MVESQLMTQSMFRLHTVPFKEYHSQAELATFAQHFKLYNQEEFHFDSIAVSPFRWSKQIQGHHQLDTARPKIYMVEILTFSIAKLIDLTLY